MDNTKDQTVTAKHIESKPDVCGGKPCVIGTRIRVWDIHVWHTLQGRTPEEIVANFPQLTIADVYAALAYYFDHREQIEQQMKDADEFVARLEAAQGETRYSKLRQALRTGKDDNADPVSP